MFQSSGNKVYVFGDMCRGEKIIEFAGDTKTEDLANNKVQYYQIEEDLNCG